MSNSKVEALVENEQQVTEKAIQEDLNNNHYDALYFATEKQIDNLIQKELISEDFSSMHQEYQEEMRIMKEEAASEFK